MRAVAHVLMKLAQARNRGLNMDNVPKEIIKWTGLKINTWKKAEKVWINRGGEKKRSDIVVKFLFPGTSVYRQKY